MKKLFAAMILAVLCVSAVSAFEVDLTKPATEITLPADWSAGKWFDAKWDAYWEIGNNTIRLYKGEDLIIDFAGKVKNFSLKTDTKGVHLAWDCDETNRSYSITKPITLGTDLQLIVDRHDVPDTDPNKHMDVNIIKHAE